MAGWFRGSIFFILKGGTSVSPSPYATVHSENNFRIVNLMDFVSSLTIWNQFHYRYPKRDSFNRYTLKASFISHCLKLNWTELNMVRTANFAFPLKMEDEKCSRFHFCSKNWKVKSRLGPITRAQWRSCCSHLANDCIHNSQ